jgi:hypothetical protein
MSQTPEPLLSAMAEYGGVTYNRADALQVLAKALAEHAQVVVTQHFGKFKLHFLTKVWLFFAKCHKNCDLFSLPVVFLSFKIGFTITKLNPETLKQFKHHIKMIYTY